MSNEHNEQYGCEIPYDYWEYAHDNNYTLQIVEGACVFARDAREEALNDDD